MMHRSEVRIVLLLVFVAFGFVFAASRKGERIRAVAMLAGWLLPGAGHAVLGRWKKALFFLTVLSATYLFGLWITGFRPVSFDENPFYFVGQYGSGVTFALAKLLGPEKAFPRANLPVSWYDPGLLYVCVAGLLNLVVVVSLIDLPRAAAAPGSAPSAPVPAPEKGTP
jgi:hypothetical protein